MLTKSFLIFIFTLMIALPAFAQGDVGDDGNWEPPVFEYETFSFLKDGHIYTAKVYPSQDIVVELNCFCPLFRKYYIKVWSPTEYAIAKFKRCRPGELYKRYQYLLSPDCEVNASKRVYYYYDNVRQKQVEEKYWKIPFLTHSEEFLIPSIDSNLIAFDTRKLDFAAKSIYLHARVADDQKYDIPPIFPGGMDSLVSFVLQRIDYSVYNKADVVGTVLVEFVVEVDGSISSPEIKVRLFPDCDENALQIVREMPRWQPATYKGKAIRCKYTLPVTFIM